MAAATTPDPGCRLERQRIPDPREFAGVEFDLNWPLSPGTGLIWAELADSRPPRIRGGRARPRRACRFPTLAPVDPNSSY